MSDLPIQFGRSFPPFLISMLPRQKVVAFATVVHERQTVSPALVAAAERVLGEKTWMCLGGSRPRQDAPKCLCAKLSEFGVTITS